MKKWGWILFLAPLVAYTQSENLAVDNVTLAAAPMGKRSDVRKELAWNFFDNAANAAPANEGNYSGQDAEESFEVENQQVAFESEAPFIDLDSEEMIGSEEDAMVADDWEGSDELSSDEFDAAVAVDDEYEEYDEQNEIASRPRIVQRNVREENRAPAKVSKKTPAPQAKETPKSQKKSAAVKQPAPASKKGAAPTSKNKANERQKSAAQKKSASASASQKNVQSKKSKVTKPGFTEVPGSKSPAKSVKQSGSKKSAAASQAQKNTQSKQVEKSQKGSKGQAKAPAKKSSSKTAKQANLSKKKARTNNRSHHSGKRPVGE